MEWGKNLNSFLFKSSVNCYPKQCLSNSFFFSLMWNITLIIYKTLILHNLPVSGLSRFIAFSLPLPASGNFHFNCIVDFVHSLSFFFFLGKSVSTSLILNY